MESPWSFAAEQCKSNTRVVLVIVVDATGSVPGKPGALMMVSPSEVVGTVGGGVAESKMITLARSHGPGITLTSFRHTEETGSLCLGIQRVALCQLTATELPTLDAISDSLSRGQCGVIHLSPAGLAFTSGSSQARSFSGSDSDWSFRDTIGPSDTLFIIGGGHVALALSKVMATLPFRIVVLDNREGLPTMQQNCHAHETRVIDYGEVDRHVSDGDLSWAVIMTYGHQDDEAVLELLVGRRFRYLGLMGSKAKIRQIFSSLSSKGVRQTDLARVTAPVGLPISSHTPAEIAVSIAAEIIRLRNQSD